MRLRGNYTLNNNKN